MILTGVVASKASTVDGPARVIRKESQLAEIERGDVLVIPVASPDFTPALRIISAVISEKGGKTAHLANVCREDGIPCIVSVQGAMKIKTGQRLIVDTYSGTVHVM